MVGTGDAEAAVRRWVEAGGGRLVLDGGLATELEANGADLNDPLWSAKCLLGAPHLIRKVHVDYLKAGSNIIISSSYQATIQGFESKGFSKEESENLLTKSVEIAKEAREVFLKEHSNQSPPVQRPILVAASIGSYGAYLADGSEYSGDYGEAGTLEFLKEAREVFLKEHSNQSPPVQRPILVAASIGSYGAYLADGSEYSGDYGEAGTLEFLKDFHRRRFQVLAEAGPDLIAFETIPNKLEAQAYAELLEECNINIPAWFSFNSKDGVNVVSGDSLIECATIADKCGKVGAVGINCTPPRFIHGLILSIRKVTDKPILIYPNSGERYDGEKKEWVESTGVTDGDFVSYVREWCKDGAALIGGCCRTTPNTIRAIFRTLNQGGNKEQLSAA